ncbi:tripartite tricarboxylate transporter substrate binding protein [Bordetella sp. FB-8]|uniref:Bug family tripartite tricarboxylate transporter substrate binding protein n=1 Tax=Bordetella sp. FB-8 TaxID=1159870 RepID=UPI00035D93A4|nr:tripartite tricarboxylate transporter substrate binding protein [Bordetella sp. FB-8]
MFARIFILAVCAAAISLTAPALAQEGFPKYPIHLIVPQSAGSGGDLVARLISEKMGSVLGQPVVVENRPGANGVIAASFVAKSAPDGYTLMMAGVSQMSFNPYLYLNLPYDPKKDFTYVSPVIDTPFILVASKASGITSIHKLIAAAKAKPGALTFSSAGTGNSTHLATEMVADAAGIKLTHIPFKGSGPALNAVLGGQVDLMTSVLGSALPQVTSGGVVPLAVLSDHRVAELPNVPTLKETGLDAPSMPGWFAIVGPAGMPTGVVDRLNAATQAALKDPTIHAHLKALYFMPFTGSADEMRQRAEKDSEFWGAFVHRLGLHAE